MFISTRRKRRKLKIPHGIRLLAWATTIRWAGWGFFEALLPVFLFSFSGSYAETGILQSTFDIVFLLALPFAGLLADKVPARTIIMAGLLFYPLVGIGYFLAGATGIVLFVVLARVFNALGWSLESVGRITYFMRHAGQSKIASTFGYFETLSNFWWLIAVLSGIFIIRIVPLHWLFLILIPTHLIAFFMVSRLGSDRTEGFKQGFMEIWHEGAYLSIFREIKAWSRGLRGLGFMSFFFGFIAVVADFFIPIYTYAETGSFEKVIFITAVMAVPSLFGNILGRIADRYKTTSIIAGFAVLSLMILALASTPIYWLQVIIAFIIKAVLELIDLAADGVAVRITNPDHFGRLNSVIGEASDIGALLGPIAIGFMVEGLGVMETFVILSALTLGVGVLMALLKKDFDNPPLNN